MMKSLRTTALVQLQIADRDVRSLRASETGDRIVIYAEGHEVILERITLERALKMLPRKPRGNGKSRKT